MNEANLLKRIDQSVTGDGFRRSKNLNMFSYIRVAADGTGLTASSVPAIVALETNALGIKLVAGQTALGKLQWTVPLDYDETQDELLLRILCNASGATASAILISSAVYAKRALLAVKTLSAAVAADAVCASGAGATLTAKVTQLNLKGLGIKPGDCLTLVLTTSTIATDDLYVYGMQMVYRTNLAISDKDDR